MEYLGFSVLLLVALVLSSLSALAQHKYYARTVRMLAREHNKPGLVLVSGQARGRWRGAVAVLVLRKKGEVIEAARVMEGSSVLARFKERPDWVGQRAAGPLPRCSTRAAAAVAEALKRVPGKPQLPTAPAGGPLTRMLGLGRSARARSGTP